jgi:hypothetical protein
MYVMEWVTCIMYVMDRCTSCMSWIDVHQWVTCIMYVMDSRFERI